MPLFVSEDKLNKLIKEGVRTSLMESSRRTQLDISTLFDTPYNSVLTSQMTSTLYSQYKNGITPAVKNAMLNDGIISRVIDMWISDALQKDVVTKEVYLVDVDTLDTDKVKAKELDEIKDDIFYFRNNSNLDSLLPQILYNIIVYGNCTVRLGYVDKYEETKIKLFESEKEKLNESAFLDTLDMSKLLDADPEFSEVKDSKKKIKRISGRYYVEILPSKLVPLSTKGITILYLDSSTPTKVLNPKNITNFINRKGNVKTLAIKENSEDANSDVYTIDLGESFVDKAVIPWSMLQSVEDCTMLALLTRSAIYRLFQIDVGAMSTKETEKLIQEFKNRLTTRESIDIRSKYYSSTNTTLPLGDSIIIPTRNGIGTVNLQTVGNDLSIDTENPLKYFRQQLLASLGVPEGLIYGDTGNGGLINTSATKQDIRYLRTIQQFTSILQEGLIEIYRNYLKMIGVDTSRLDINVNFAQINSEEDLDRINYEQTKLDALSKAISGLESLGITFDKGDYKATKELIISRYLDSELLDAIKEDELKIKNTPQASEDKHTHSSSPLTPPSKAPDIDIDIDNDTTPETPEDTTSDTGEEYNPRLDLDNLSTLEEPVDQTEV